MMVVADVPLSWKVTFKPLAGIPLIPMKGGASRLVMASFAVVALTASISHMYPTPLLNPLYTMTCVVAVAPCGRSIALKVAFVWDSTQ